MIKKIVSAIIIIIAILIFNYFFSIYYPVSKNNSEEIRFVIVKGDAVKQISKNLYSIDLIRSSGFFNFYIWLSGDQADFKAGEYILNKNMSLIEIVNKLISNEALSHGKKITIIEGWNINDIDNYFKKNNYFINSSFSDLVKTKIVNWPFKISKPDFLNQVPASAGLEGFLFPDTYKFFQDAVAEDIIIKMLNNFDKKLTLKMRKDIIDQNRTIYQTIIIASIIEKEVRTFDDMQIVSGLFWDRIKNKQPLQSCATLAYALGERKKQYSLEDTKVDSPYNTYKNSGLPVGPISNPGLNAIKAAIYPKYTDYNYFLSRFDTGEIVFSKTFDEHNRNKEKYLK